MDSITATNSKTYPLEALLATDRDQREPVELRVTGTFPPLLAGTLYRNGPGTHRVDSKTGSYARSHWFDGFALLRRFQIVPKDGSNCRVFYNSRLQVDALMEKARRTGDLKEVTFGQKRDPCESFFQKMKTVFEPTDSLSDPDPQMVNSNVTVFANMPGMLKHGPTVPASSQFKVLTCLTDANQITHANPETLEPIAASTQEELHRDLKGQLSCAHPQFDPKTGDVYNYNLHLGPRSTYRIYHTSAHTSKTEVIATFSTKAAYIHSFFITQDYIILCVWPSYFKGLGASILWERNMLDAMKFDSTAQTHWFVVDRKGHRGVVSKFVSPPFFAFHTINAFQEPRDKNTVDIICDMVQYTNMDALHRTYYEDLLSPNGEVSNFTLKRSETPMTVRYRLPRVPKESTTRTVVAAERVFGFESGELPTINPRFATKRARYHYCVVNRGYTSFFDGIGKVDLETQTVQYWGSETTPHTPSEPIFIPDGTGEAEDAGYLLSVVLNGETGTSYLVCLDARTLTEVGRAEHDHAISFGLHGSYYSAV
ncbi:putative dioxygenase [Aspergillus fischeri NRRL 181]|uniref:Retinal pigment epithelial membrane family protein n=1 Tax=Neosartorya fischeri (strain ATCC 1020 / DSM 3700 / CBS 544.65 / FGSC A1164 / JCM 1740 / NRRL 181 / WB 181) TaxID=331117 RepID=A1D132_NEOFI|nr:retinal pigment epithelial membrane family protein [Aspergillus fischeri NRRL 181]EAW22125.1 retinal pigment epithelial membrane family protein [Aspergillus fischeri NRRL 181]